MAESRIADQLAGKTLRVAILAAIAFQMIVGWAVPILLGAESDAQRIAVRLTDWRFGDGFGWVALVVGIAHMASLAWPSLQRASGISHTVACVFIGVRLIQVGFTYGGLTYLLAWSLLGVAVAVTAPSKSEIS